MDGSKKKVRKVPDSSRMTKEYSATSPNMNDQWSGKTLRPNSRRIPEPPTRASTKSVTRPVLVLATKVGSAVDAALMHITLPVTWSYGFMEVAGSDEVALIINCDGQLGEGTAGGAEDHLALLREVKGGLVARAQQVVRLLLVQSNGATDVGADLGVCNDAVVTPLLAALGRVQGSGIQAHEQHNGLGLFVELALV